jgi:hypothetical protein
LFRAIEDTLCAQNRPMMLARLTREAAVLACREAESIGFEFGNWNTTSQAVVKTMLCAGTLLTEDGCAIPADITAQATTVAALRDDFRDLAESFLLEFLIRRMGDITTRDHRALAHALFRQFDRRIPVEDLEDRLVILLARLVDRVSLVDDAYATRE